MQLIGAILLALCVISKGTDGLYIRTPTEAAERCDKLYTVMVDYIEVYKTEMPSIYQQARTIEMMLGVDLSDSKQLKAFTCKIASAKTVRDLYNIMPIGDYESLVFAYSYSQKMIISIGGYTNTRRLLGIYHDLKEWIVSLNITDPSQIKTKTDLASVTRFSEVMQVKYGSRWLSLPVLAENEEILIEDPKAFAKALFECTSKADFQTKTSIKLDYVNTLWKIFEFGGDLMYGAFKLDRKSDDAVVRGENVVGDLGFYNLKY